MFADVLPAAFLREIDLTRRNRHFGFLPVFWAWFAQIIEVGGQAPDHPIHGAIPETRYLKSIVSRVVHD